MVKCGSLGVYLHELNFCRYTSWFEHFHLSSLFLFFFNYNLSFSLPYLFFLSYNYLVGVFCKHFRAVS